VPNFGGFWGLWVSGLKKSRFLLQRERPCANPRRLSHFAKKIVKGCGLHVGVRKNEVMKIVYFTYFQKPHWSDWT